MCHVEDNSTLYIEMLRRILANENLPSGKHGYYLASPGSVAWDDLYAAIGKALKRRNVLVDDKVRIADKETMELMAKGLGCPIESVPLQMGGW